MQGVLLQPNMEWDGNEGLVFLIGTVYSIDLRCY